MDTTIDIFTQGSQESQEPQVFQESESSQESQISDDELEEFKEIVKAIVGDDYEVESLTKRDILQFRETMGNWSPFMHCASLDSQNISSLDGFTEKLFKDVSALGQDEKETCYRKLVPYFTGWFNNYEDMSQKFDPRTTNTELRYIKYEYNPEGTNALIIWLYRDEDNSREWGITVKSTNEIDENPLVFHMPPIEQYTKEWLYDKIVKLMTFPQQSKLTLQETDDSPEDFSIFKAETEKDGMMRLNVSPFVEDEYGKFTLTENETVKFSFNVLPQKSLFILLASLMCRIKWEEVYGNNAI